MTEINIIKILEENKSIAKILFKNGYSLDFKENTIIVYDADSKLLVVNSNIFIDVSHIKSIIGKSFLDDLELQEFNFTNVDKLDTEKWYSMISNKYERCFDFMLDSDNLIRIKYFIGYQISYPIKYTKKLNVLTLKKNSEGTYILDKYINSSLVNNDSINIPYQGDYIYLYDIILKEITTSIKILDVIYDKDKKEYSLVLASGFTFDETYELWHVRKDIDTEEIIVVNDKLPVYFEKKIYCSNNKTDIYLEV